jgi:hypothetical protein
MKRQLELVLICHGFEEQMSEEERERLQSVLTEMLRAYFRELLPKETNTDGKDPSQP